MRDVPVLFLKATIKKKVFIPTFTRGDGTTVQGHYAFVHVADGHDEGRVLAGQGTHSQRQAHAALAREKWFNGLPQEHKANVLLEHATGIQDKASAAARVSTFRKKVLAGGRPTRGELNAFDAAPPDKQRAIAAELRAAGKVDALPERYHDLEAPAPKEKPAPKPKREKDFGEKPKAAAAPAKARPELAKLAAKAEAEGKHVEWMTPQQYLDLSPEMDPNQGKIAKIRASLAAGEPLRELPSITVEKEADGTGGAVAQEGRHRTTVLAEEGHEKIPVIIASHPRALGWGPETVKDVPLKSFRGQERDNTYTLNQGAGGKPAAKQASSVDEHVAAINAARLPTSNSNARVVNLKLDAIAAAVKAGDAGLLTMMPYGTNTYGKKAVKLANDALALLGSDERVTAGQKGTPGFRSDAQIAAAKAIAKAQRTVDPEKDSLMTAIAKLGGLKPSDAKSQWGLAANDIKGHRVGILPVFSGKGRSIAQMAEALHELGYLQTEGGNELGEHVENGMAGGDHFTPSGYANKAQDMHEAHYQGLTEDDVAASGFDHLLPEAQNHIEEWMDENPEFSAEEVAAFERAQRLADADGEVDFDFGAEKSRHRDFGQAHEGSREASDVPF